MVTWGSKVWLWFGFDLWWPFSKCSFFDELFKAIFVYMAWKAPRLAISVDELSGRDQMGQNKPFFKKSWGHIKRLQKVTFPRTAQKFGLKTWSSHDDGDHWSGTALVFSKTYRPHPFSGETTQIRLSFCQKVDFTPKNHNLQTYKCLCSLPQIT